MDINKLLNDFRRTALIDKSVQKLREKINDDLNNIIFDYELKRHRILDREIAKRQLAKALLQSCSDTSTDVMTIHVLNTIVGET